MEIKDAIALLQSNRINFTGKKTWADLGCGNGMFTKALAHLLEPQSVIYAVDANLSAFNKIPNLYHKIEIKKRLADFENDPLPFKNLDGILMANALHYVNDKKGFIQKLQTASNKNHCFLIIEYDTDVPVNTWVPYPISFTSLQQLFTGLGYSFVQKLHERPSIFGRGKMYSAFITQ